MGAILALTFCAVACKTDDDDDPTVTPQKTAGSISYATTTVSKTTADGVFTNELTKTGDGTVTYASSKETVATVNEDGEVTIKGAGETTITASVADSDTYTYATKTASYTLTVKQPVTLKTGGAIHSILVSLCKDEYGYSVCTKFARSNTNNEKATLYLDTEEKYIPVWSDGTEVYYYVPDGCTPVMNEDSSGMFSDCLNLTSLDVSKFDTSKVTNMESMFNYCSKLTSLDVTGFDTSNVTNMESMFASCFKLTGLDVSKFDTSKVTNMSYMFFCCSGLKSLDVTGFNTSNVTNMAGMFSYCSGLASLDVTGFDTSKVSNMQSMFYGCSGLTNLDVSKFVTSKVENMSSMFGSCSGLNSLDVSKLDTSNVTNMSDMFYNCSGLTNLDVSKFVTSKVEYMKEMFSGCEGLTSLDLSKFNTSKVTDMSKMFSGCKGLTSLDLSSFDTSNVTYMKEMFSGCEGLTTIYATDKFVTTSVTKGDYCFNQCSNLEGGAGTTYDSSKVSADYARIDGGPDSASPGYFTLKPIGSKSKPDAVGDIVFSDGSATAYTSELTNEQKSKAVAVIFYAGSASDTLGAKTLGVGLKNTGTDNELEWAKDDDVNGFSTNITAIQCTPSESGSGKAATATFTGDTDGSDNWKALCDAVSDEGTNGNYPAWEWVNAYATENLLAGDYASGWYLPTVAELSILYRAKDTVNSALEKAGGMIIADEGYWSSSQSASSDYSDNAWDVYFEDGYLIYDYKGFYRCVCTVRAF